MAAKPNLHLPLRPTLIDLPSMRRRIFSIFGWLNAT
jgi:hypothetical protein